MAIATIHCCWTVMAIAWFVGKKANMQGDADHHRENDDRAVIFAVRTRISRRLCGVRLLMTREFCPLRP